MRAPSAPGTSTWQGSSGRPSAAASCPVSTATHAGRRLGRARVEAQDAGVGVRAAKHDRVGLALDVDVVREAPGAGHEARVFLAPHRLADAELVHLLAFHEGGRRRAYSKCFSITSVTDC